MIAVRATTFLLKCITLSSFVGLAVAAGVHYGAPPTPNKQTNNNTELSIQIPITLSFTFTNTEEKNRWVPLTKDVAERTEQQEIIASRYDRGAFALLQEDVALVTYNDGESFETLRCPATSKPLKADFSGSLRLFVLCDDHRSLLVHTPQQTTIQELPFTQAPDIFLTNQTHLVWIAQTEQDELFASSSNNGETWESSPQDFVLGNDLNVASLSEGGVIQLIAGSEAGCGGGGQRRYTRSLNRAGWAEQPWPLDSPSSFALGSSGWAYALNWTYEDGEAIEQLMALAPNKAEPLLVLSTKSNENRWSIASNVSRDVLQWDNALYSLQKGKTKLLTQNLPEEFTLMAVDANGSALGFFRGNLTRFSEEYGWQLLAQK